MLSDFIKDKLETFAWSKNPDDIDEFFKLLNFRKLKIIDERYVYDGSISPQYTQLNLLCEDGEEGMIFVPFGFQKPSKIEDFF